MKTAVISLFVVAASSYAILAEESFSKEYFDGIINHVKNAGATWEADHNFDHFDSNVLGNLLGSLESENEHEHLVDVIAAGKHIVHKHHPKLYKPDDFFVAHANHTKEFDGTKEWKHCKSVNHVYNQGKCASDWALAPIAAISDRICLHSKGKEQITLSPHEPISCCKTCGWGCKKGYPSMVYAKYVTKGFVTGGDYNSKKGCQPYEIKSCRGSFKKCFAGEKTKTPECKKKCYNTEYKGKYENDRHKGAVAFRYGCPYCLGEEVKAHGPVTATMIVYEDFLTYKKGIYHHVTGKKLGMLTVKIVGFNDNDPNNKYWIAVNSWGTKWGEKGFFKIRRGVDECMFEGSLRGALVEDDDKPDSQLINSTE